ncbi:MAG: hypothetical protein RIQ99_1486, partial [Pseudomonadota bacterium]
MVREIFRDQPARVTGGPIDDDIERAIGLCGHSKLSIAAESVQFGFTQEQHKSGGNVELNM